MPRVRYALTCKARGVVGSPGVLSEIARVMHLYRAALARARPRLRALTACIGLLVLTGPLTAQQNGTLWVGETQGALRIATSDGALLGEIPEVGHVRALGVDPVGERVWLYSSNTLYAYALDGTQQIAANVPGLPLTTPAMAVDPVAGSVWIAGLTRLTGFDSSGQVISQQRLPELMRALAVDPLAGVLWVAGKSEIYGYDTTSGAAVRTISLAAGASPLRALAVDSGGVLWVATRDDLRRLAPDGTEDLREPIAKLLHVAPDGAGGAWAAGIRDVLRVAGDGSVTATLRPFSSGGQIVDLAADGRDGSVWAANLTHLARIEGDGQVTKTLRLAPAVLVRDLDLWRPPIPPGITIDSPADGAVLATGTPEIDLTFAAGDLPVDPQSLAVSADGSPIAVSCDLDVSGGTCSPVAPLGEGSVTLSATVADIAGRLSEPGSVTFTVDTVAPVITLSSPVDGQLTNQPTLLLAGSVSEPADLTIDGAPAPVAPDLGFTYGPLTLVEGLNPITLTATDAAGNVGELAVAVTLDTQAPAAIDPAALGVSEPSGGAVTVTGAPGAAEPGAVVTVTDPASGGSATGEAGADGSFSLSLAASAGDSLSVVQTDAAGNSGPATIVTVPTPGGGAGGLPPDPAQVAPPLDRTVATDIGLATAFLYSGSDPIQTDLVPGTIDEQRAAVVRGRVEGRDGAPVTGVRISIHDHPEYGSTLSRADGMFDLAVNGGGLLTVDYEKEGYLPAQRPVDVPWRDWVWADPVVLVALYPQATVVTSGSTEVQVARGSREEDADGTRTATLLIPAGTTAEMVLPDGSRQALPTWTLRATEYTVGGAGPTAMPGALPPEVAYTYAVELSADEAIAAGARSVDLSQPAFLYVENFLGFPVGGPVPDGWYDREGAAWVASDNGRVMEVLGVDGTGRATIDFDGDGSADSDAALAAAGFTDAERTQLAALYGPGTQLWRTPIPHLTPWDCNWPYNPPEDATEPPPDDRANDEGRDEDDPDCTQGSIIECQTEVLGESLPVAGTPFQLSYRSDRIPGRTAAYRLPIRLSGSTVPSSLKRIELEIEVAGRRTFLTFPPSPDQTYTFAWDGRDAYGRRLQGSATVQVKKSYVYDPVYTEPEDRGREWTRFSGATQVTAIGTRDSVSEFRLTRTSHYWVGLANRATLGGWDATAEKLGGWSLDVHHAYDPAGRRLWLGNGRRRSAHALPPLLHIAAQAVPEGIAVGPDGSLYVTEYFDNRVYRFDRNGASTVVAGDGTECRPANPTDPSVPTTCGDGGPAVAAQLRGPEAVALAPDGSILIADTGNNCVRRVGTDGIIETVAGQCNGGGGPVAARTPPGPSLSPEAGTNGLGCDDCTATDALLSEPFGLAVAPDGSFFVSDLLNDRVRRVGTDGRIFTVAGGGTPADGLGDGGPALAAIVSRPGGLALGSDGSLYIAEPYSDRIRRVSPDGKISTAAGGNKQANFCGDGGPAVDACLSFPLDVDIAPDGSLLIADTNNRRVRRVSLKGTIETLAGGKDGGPYPEDAPGSAAAGVDLDYVGAVAHGPDGAVYLTQSLDVLRLSPALGGVAEGETLIPDAGGRQVFVFDRNGRHLRTVDALTGASLYTFHYDSAGLLTEIVDVDGKSTRIERNASGDATAIVGPYGQRTVLRDGPDGYLTQVENPAGEVTSFTHSSSGLLESMTDPRGFTKHYTYAGFGQLVRADDPAGGFKTLTRTAYSDNAYSVELTTALGRSTLYSVQRTTSGERYKTRQDPDGTFTAQVDLPDGSSSTTHADGTVATVEWTADPRWGLLAPILGNSEVKTPSGLTATVSTRRSVTLTDPEDPLAVDTITDTTTVNGATFTRTYDASTRRFTVTSPEGRQWFLSLDAKGRASEIKIPGIAPLVLSHDASGRLSQVTQGTGSDLRTSTFDYDSAGWLAGASDPLQQLSRFSTDATGRLTTQTLPDGRTIGFTYL